jgi:glutamine synthetase type III
VDEINNIRKDIEENLETIVDKLDEEDLKNNLNYYRQKLQVYMHKVEEQADFFTKLISFTPE